VGCRRSGGRSRRKHLSVYRSPRGSAKLTPNAADTGCASRVDQAQEGPSDAPQGQGKFQGRIKEPTSPQAQGCVRDYGKGPLGQPGGPFFMCRGFPNPGPPIFFPSRKPVISRPTRRGVGPLAYPPPQAFRTPPVFGVVFGRRFLSAYSRRDVPSCRFAYTLACYRLSA
jgi:hypothetical protein